MGSKATASDVASYVLELLGGEEDALKLEKLVYYAETWHLAWEGEPLFEEDIFTKWTSPRIDSLHEQFSGALRVEGEDICGDASNLTGRQKESIRSVVDFYGDKSSHYLAQLVKQEEPIMETRIDRDPDNDPQEGPRRKRWRSTTPASSPDQYSEQANTPSSPLKNCSTKAEAIDLF